MELSQHSEMISFLAEHRDSSVEIVQNIQMHLFYFINSTQQQH